jgi:hypothetical protein
MPLILTDWVVCVVHPPAEDASCPEHAPHALAVHAEKIARILAENWQKNVQHRARFAQKYSVQFFAKTLRNLLAETAEFLCANTRRRSALEPDVPRPFFTVATPF